MVIDGKKIAAEIIKNLKKEPRPEKFVAAILVGENPGSAGFLNQKGKIARELGIDFRLYKFPGDIKRDPLRKEVLKIVSHKTCGGAIVQLHLPDHINNHYVLNVIPREKDLDVLGERALGAFYAERGLVLPPAVGVVQKIMEFMGWSLEEKSVAVVGLGILIGKPIANWLMRKAKTLFLLRRGSDLGILKNADLVVIGVGKAGLIEPGMLREGATVLDFGYDRKDGKIHGDFDASTPINQSTDKLINYNYTPTPGGTGPILIAKLFENFYKLNS